MPNSVISEISPDGGTTNFDLKDKNAQTKNLSSPITVRGSQKLKVETALSALASAVNEDTCYVQDNVLYVPSNKGSVSDGVLVLT